MLDLLLLGITALLIAFGLKSPAVAYAGYMWTDILRPQDLGSGFSISIPYSLLLAGTCVLSMLMNSDQVRKPTSPWLFGLLLVFVLWFNLTTLWAAHPAAAAFKLDWATKSLGFVLVAFMVIHTRASLELFLVVFVICVGYFAVQTGIKTAITGGGYGAQLIHGGNNNGMSESSTLGGTAAACIPIILYLRQWSVLIPSTKLTRAGLTATAVVFVIAIVGTHSRTGLVCLIGLAVGSLFVAKHKIRVILLATVAGAVLFQFAGSAWLERMSTITEADSESSAVGRVAVWRWTLDYAKSHPFGGGFDAYLDNAGQLYDYLPPSASLEAVKPTPKAFHSIYFEVLGEQGYLGLSLFLLLLGSTFLILMRARRPLPASPVSMKEPLAAVTTEIPSSGDDWIRVTANTVLLYFLCLVVTGLFVGIAYRPYLAVAAVSAGVLMRERRMALASARLGSTPSALTSSSTLPIFSPSSTTRDY